MAEKTEKRKYREMTDGEKYQVLRNVLIRFGIGVGYGLAGGAVLCGVFMAGKVCGYLDTIKNITENIPDSADAIEELFPGVLDLIK